MDVLPQRFLDYLKSKGFVVKTSGGILRWDGKYAESDSRNHLFIGWYEFSQPTAAWLEEITRQIVGFLPYNEIEESLQAIRSQNIGRYIGDCLVSPDESSLSFRSKVHPSPDGPNS